MPRAFATHLMFDGAAEQAMNLYASVFRDCRIGDVERYGPGEQGAEGAVKKATFTLGRHELTCFDSPVKHEFTFTPSISLVADCEDEAELDRAYEQLSDGGELLMPLDNCGFSTKFAWLNDRFGVSWQLNLR